MTSPPDWIKPGESTTLIWYDAAEARPDGIRVYQVAGPILEGPPRSPYYLLAPLEQSEFAQRLYRNAVTLPELRRFLDVCTLGRGWISEALDVVFTRAEIEPRALIDAWSALDRPLVSYVSELDAFLWDDLPPVYVSPEAYLEAQRVAEGFQTAWVCAGCGEAEDAAVFFWTRSREGRVRVCFLVQNEGGRWTCQLHPFEFHTTESLSLLGRGLGEGPVGEGPVGEGQVG
jgi:hypothetical protein